jgi:hypothetical protein
VEKKAWTTLGLLSVPRFDNGSPRPVHFPALPSCNVIVGLSVQHFDQSMHTLTTPYSIQ